MKNDLLIKSTVILSAAALISKILGSIFRIPLQNIAGDEVLGIFTLVYPVYMVALTLSVAGIPLAISILISQSRTKGNQDQIRDLFYTSSVLSLFFGAASFILIYAFSSEIAYLLGGSSARLSLIIVSSTLLIAPYMAVYRGFFQGYSKMTPTAVSQVIEQFIRVGVILLAALYMTMHQFEDKDIAAGVMAGSLVGAAGSFVYLRILFRKSLIFFNSQNNFNMMRFMKTGKTILKLSIPICVGAVTMALLNLIDSLTIPLSLKSYGISETNINYLYGIYGRGLALVQVLTIFAASIVLTLIPSISSKIVKNDKSAAKEVIGNSFFLILIFSLPTAIAFSILIEPINIALFSNTEGSKVMAIILAGSVFTSLTILGTGILQGLGSEKAGAIIILIGAFLKIPLNLFLVKNYGLSGAAISTALIYFLLFVVNLIFIWKRLRFNFFSRKIAGIVAASIMMGFCIAISMLLFQFNGHSRILALLYAAIFSLGGTLAYIGFLIVFKVIGREEFRKMQGLLSINK